MKRTTALPLVAFLLVAAACSSSADGPDGPGAVPSDPPSSASSTDDPDSGEPDSGDPDSGEPGSEPGTTDPGGGVVGPIGFARPSLAQFGECSAFLDYVRTEGASRVGPFGLGGDGWYGPFVGRVEGDVAFALDDAAEEASADGGSFDAAPATTAPALAESSAGSGEPATDPSFSTTNVQVEGVDEPDIVKTDGDRVLALINETLHYIDIDGTTATKRGSVGLTDAASVYSYGHEIFVAGDRAFVFAQGESYGGPVVFDDQLLDAPAVDAPAVEEVDAVDELDSVDEADSADAETEFAAPEPEPIPVEPGELIGGPIGNFGPTTLIYEIDLTNPDDLRLVSTLELEGRYISARAIGDTARVVVTSPPTSLDFLFPSSPNTEDAATEANRRVIAESDVDDWVPSFRLIGANGESSGSLVECDGIYAPSNFAGFDMLSIVTLDLGAPLAGPTGTASVMAAGDTVYASQDRLYVSTNIWNPVIDEQTRTWLDENYETGIHRFSIAGDGPATYEASGSVDGHLLNQFSMNDRDGVLYVATTTGSPWSGNETSQSQIVSLAVNPGGDELTRVGIVDGLGKGEQIFSVRYVGDLAYVVTFRQTDPFYVLDLSDPANMTVEGELKIPGFSNYLHPVGDDLVIGVGQDATDDGRTTGTKVSLFDVSDPSNPLETDVWTVPGGFSDAQFDHRAFLYWPATGTAVLPLQAYSEQFAGAVVLNITADGIVEQGRITHRDDVAGPTGVTDCRVIDPAELGDGQDSELFWIAQEGGQFQLCGSDDEGGATNLFCDSYPIDDLQYWYFGDSQQIPIDVGDAERFEVCWPNWNGYEFAIQRSLVIGDTLWTLSPERLQGNDLDTLERTAAADL